MGTADDQARAARSMATIMRREAAQAVTESEAQRSRSDVMRTRNEQMRERIRSRFPAFFANR